MVKLYQIRNIFILPVLLIVLAACGGGGGSNNGDGDSDNESDNANLSSLVISAGDLTPVFSPEQVNYGIDVDVTVSDTTVTATAEDANIQGLTVDGSSLASGDTSSAIALAEGDNEIRVEVTAEDGVTAKTYTITVNRGPVVNNHTPERVVFIADRDTDEVFELYSVLDDGASTPVKISGTMVDRADVDNFQVSPDGMWVAYMSDQDNFSFPELFVAPVDGAGSAIKVVSNTFTRNFKSFAWSPDSSKLLYLGGFNARDVDELFMVDRDGNNAHIVNGSVGNSVEIGDFAWSPDGSFVAYKVFNRDKPHEVIGINSHQTGTTTGNPGYSIRISATLAPPQSIESFAWSPNNTSVAYLADQDTPGLREVYVASAGLTNSSDKISGSNGDNVFSYAWSPDGVYLGYIGESATRSTLYRSRADLVSLGSRRSPDQDIHIASFAWSPDSSKMAYRAHHPSAQAGVYELFWSDPASPLSNGTPLSASLTSGGSVKRYQWSPDASSVAYLADQDSDEIFEFYVSTVDGAVTGSKRSGPLADEGDVQAFAWSPDSSQIAFRAESDNAGVSALFTSLADGSRIATRISQTGVPVGSDVGVFSFDWAEDSNAITYHGAETVEGRLELYTGLANGHLKGSVISGALVDEGGASHRYAYDAGFESSGTYHDQITELFRDGSWTSSDRANLCGMVFHDTTDALFILRCDGSFADHRILRYSFATDDLQEVYRYPSQNDYGMRIEGDDIYIVRTYDESILRLTDLDRPYLTFVDDYLADQNLTEMNEKYDIAVVDQDFYLVAGNALTSTQHNGIHVVEEPGYNSVTELVSDVVAAWPNEPFSYERSMVHVNNALDNYLIVATGANGNLERWDINGVFQNQVNGFGSSYLQTDASERIYTVFTNNENSVVTRWAFDLSNQETFDFTSKLNGGEFLRYVFRETASSIEIYMARFRDSDLRIDTTSVPQ